MIWFDEDPEAVSDLPDLDHACPPERKGGADSGGPNFSECLLKAENVPSFSVNTKSIWE